MKEESQLFRRNRAHETVILDVIEDRTSTGAESVVLPALDRAVRLREDLERELALETDEVRASAESTTVAAPVLESLPPTPLETPVIVTTHGASVDPAKTRIELGGRLRMRIATIRTEVDAISADLEKLNSRMKPRKNGRGDE